MMHAAQFDLILGGSKELIESIAWTCSVSIYDAFLLSDGLSLSRLFILMLENLTS